MVAVQRKGAFEAVTATGARFKAPYFEFHSASLTRSSWRISAKPKTVPSLFKYWKFRRLMFESHFSANHIIISGTLT